MVVYPDPDAQLHARVHAQTNGSTSEASEHRHDRDNLRTLLRESHVSFGNGVGAI